LNLEFFKFLSWTAIWAWVLSDTTARFAVPYFTKFYNALDEMTIIGSGKGKTNYYFVKTIALLTEIIFSICLTYIMISWSVWCVLRCVLYTQGLETNRWIFFISGGLCCELAISKVAKASPHRNFLGVLPFIMSMGAFVYFSINYEPIRTTFPWMIKFVGLDSL
jgi:hypothetical protein